jgi:hypothetical protein
MNGIISDIIIQPRHLLRDELSLAGCDHLAEIKMLNASKQHHHKKSTDFGFAVNQRQTEVKSEYRKKADILDAEHHQPGDALNRPKLKVSAEKFPCDSIRKVQMYT